MSSNRVIMPLPASTTQLHSFQHPSTFALITSCPVLRILWGAERPHQTSSALSRWILNRQRAQHRWSVKFEVSDLKRETITAGECLTWRLSWCLCLPLGCLVVKQMGPESRLPLFGREKHTCQHRTASHSHLFVFTCAWCKCVYRMTHSSTCFCRSSVFWGHV